MLRQQYRRHYILSTDPNAGPRWAGLLLYAASRAYGGLMRLRAELYLRGQLRSRRMPAVVISVGNLTVGGTGKTPLVIALARHIQRLGLSVAVLSRGYKGAAEKQGGIVSDGTRIMLSPRQAGDEPYLMALALDGVPIAVGRNRYTAGMRLMQCCGPQVFILDDGFQHLRLQRDLNLVLLDAKHPLGNRHILPRGPLRELPSALKRADAFILTAASAPAEHQTAIRTLRGALGPGARQPVFRAAKQGQVVSIVPAGTPPAASGLKKGSVPAADALRHRPVFAFAGLARNDLFRASLEKWGWRLVGFKGFDDHHPYSWQDLEDLGTKALQVKARIMATTAKDYMRLQAAGPLPLDLAVLDVCLDFGADKAPFSTYLNAHLAQRRYSL